MKCEHCGKKLGAEETAVRLASGGAVVDVRMVADEVGCTEASAHNALYLASKRGKLTRISHGRYRKKRRA